MKTCTFAPRSKEGKEKRKSGRKEERESEVARANI
jgi:hypothetical protein